MSENSVCQSLYTYVRLQVSVERTKNALSYNSIIHAIISNILLSNDYDVRKCIYTTTGVAESR